MRDRARGQRIVAHNLPPHANDIGPGCAAYLIGKRPALEPVVEFRLAAYQLREIVSLAQLFRSGESPDLYLSHGALVLSKRVSPGLSAGGASSMSRNRWNASPSRLK